MTTPPLPSDATGGRAPALPRVCLSTVDPSGDAIGGLLAEALQRRGPVELYGAGGPAMRAAGVRLLCDSTEWSALGVVGWMPVLWKAAIGNRRVCRQVHALAPDLFIPIDCGGFNVPIARSLRKWRGQKVLYYIPPRSWSRRWRVGRLAHVADYVLAPFPWNTAGDDGTGRVRFVGHPAADLLARLPSREEARRQLGLAPEGLTIALLPGSRRLELRVHLPVLLRAAALLRDAFPGLQVILSRARTVGEELLRGALTEANLASVCIAEGAGLALRAADAALVCLGTATLEGCVLGCPMATFYRGTTLQGVEYLLKPPRTRFYAMPNIIAGEPVLPEIVQWAVTPERLAHEAAALLRDPAARQAMGRRLRDIAQQLGGEGAVGRAAEAVWAALEGRWHEVRSVPAAAPAGMPELSTIAL